MVAPPSPVRAPAPGGDGYAASSEQATQGIADILIVGGGLSGGLLALALRTQRPDLRIALVDAGKTIGGNHIWSFFDSDIDAADRWLIAPLITRGWPEHDVRFNHYERRFAGNYASIESERLDSAVRQAIAPQDLMLGARVEHITTHAVHLTDGRRIAAHAIVDARGIIAPDALRLGWQKFLGQLWSLDAPHGLTRPLIMDASVDQSDGYRFIYLLPFSPTDLFIEDTYYATDPALDTALLSARIAAYVERKGWRGKPADRSESGVLPVCTGGDIAPLIAKPVASIGTGAGLFHAMTGYSLPDAVRVATTLAALPDLNHAALLQTTRALAQSHWKGQAFYRLLANMLFHAADPPDRHNVLARFYRLDPALIARFYAGRSTLLDKLRIVSGRPPVPLRRAIAALGAPQR